MTLARNWRQRSDGSQARMALSALMLRQLAGMINFGLGKVPRIIASMARNADDLEAGSADTDPTWVFPYLDRHSNGRAMRASLLMLPRQNAPGGGGDAVAHREGDTSDTTLALYSGTTVGASSSYPANLELLSFRYERGDKSDAMAELGLSRLNGAIVVGIVAQDEPLNLLEGDLDHDLAPIDTMSGQPVIATNPEAIRAALQALREDYLPIETFWSANDCESGNQPVSSGPTAIVVTGDTEVNVLDGTSTARTATTPGLSMHVQHAGHGPPSTTSGKRVRHHIYILAWTDDEEAYIRVEGSSTFSSNEDSATVTGLTPTLYKLESGVYSDASIADDNNATSRNKLDIFGYCATDGGTSLWIGGITVERIHE
jgi:hypothetical protein